MSEIAQALAKAKERTGQTTAPFLSAAGPLAPVPGVAPASPAAAAAEAKARKARNSQRFWLVVAIVALPLTGFVLWTRLAPTLPASSGGEPVAASASAGPGLGGVSTSSGSAAPALPVASAKSASSPAATPRAEIAGLVARLPISAVLPGDPPRIMVSGRVVRIGEAAEGELVFAGVQDHDLIFKDARGATYARRY